MKKEIVMRKLLVILFILSSMVIIGEPYKVTVKPKAKVSQKYTKENSVQIEKAVKEKIKYLSRKEILNEIFDINFNGTEEDTVILAMLRGIMNVAMRNSEFEIKEIEYISETEANVKLKVKYPDIDKDENRIFKKAEENFKKKTGLTIEQVQMIESEKEKMKYVMESVKIILQTFEEEVSKARRTLDTEIEISVEKKQNKWIVLEDVFEFMEKIYD
jgi:hypothetical protein